MNANGGHLARRQIEERHVDVGDRQILRNDRAFLVGRKRANIPTPAFDFGNHPACRWVARVHHIDVIVGAVAPRRRIGDQLAIIAPCIYAVAAFAVGQQRKLAVLQRIDLVKFIAANIFLRQQYVAGFRSPAAAANGLRLKANLLTGHHRPGDAMQLRGIAETGRNQHGFVGRMPTGEACRTKFHIGPCLRGQFIRHGGDTIGDQRIGLRRVCKGRCHGQSQRGNQKKFLHVYPLL